MHHSDLPNMARVCRAFWAPVARVLWEVVPSITPLLECFSGDQQSMEHNEASQSKQLAMPGWERFQQYAPLVKDLTAEVHDDVLGDLQQLQSSLIHRTFLPNLQRLRLHVAPILFQPVLDRICDLLITPRLKVLRWFLQDPLYASDADETLARVTESLKTIPLLESFTFHGYTEERSISRLVFALSSMSRLRYLDIWTFTDLPREVVQVVSQIQTLETVRLGITRDSTVPINTRSMTYPSARELQYISERSSLLWLLLSVASPLVETLSLAIYGDSVDSPFDGLGNPQDFPHLKTLSVEGDVWGWEEMTPLLAFQGLKELRICPTFIPMKEDHWSLSQIQMVARSFPILEVLVLDDRPLNFEPILLTLPDLECFARHCPHLWYLSVTVDAREAQTYKGTVTPHLALREVHLQLSKAEGHEAEVASLISRLWPNLRIGERRYLENASGSELEAQDAAKACWDRIWSLVDFAEEEECGKRLTYELTKLYRICQFDR
ncbi:hypothetical protein FRB90_005252 [Tulasnella sp. 427]|nr:hypothetical protein FRB90_005252 [Tulasnella sp. 427]